MELTLDRALQKGIESHKACHAPKADLKYVAIFTINPKHFDVNHNMAVLTAGVDKTNQAFHFLQTALEPQCKGKKWTHSIK